ncbi:aspartyl-phosphate phosphatase Spo0E family protein [Paenibacillus thalictri]|uniref:Aspartyl-phosphate phosphatase Spo0E family protein n=1 Tax=Paenibacillus thalictri TaxID=2527873 RepID=A0A4Q9DVF4_9BACL|nr:aspartyl-phosphate phosphatase Spo0E family protein [Paenibacillus thalictri]TBL80345.1 aspartyl-phosphate phosphatase Spo0E family protein [Paenibacillus thalictri]
MDEDELTKQIEQMKSKLYKLVESEGSFVAPEVVELSQMIDRLIIQIQRLRHAKTTN